MTPLHIWVELRKEKKTLKLKTVDVCMYVISC